MADNSAEVANQVTALYRNPDDVAGESSWTSSVEVQVVLVAQHANLESDTWAGR